MILLKDKNCVSCNKELREGSRRDTCSDKCYSKKVRTWSKLQAEEFRILHGK